MSLWTHSFIAVMNILWPGEGEWLFSFVSILYNEEIRNSQDTRNLYKVRDWAQLICARKNDDPGSWRVKYPGWTLRTVLMSTYLLSPGGISGTLRVGGIPFSYPYDEFGCFHYFWFWDHTWLSSGIIPCFVLRDHTTWCLGNHAVLEIEFRVGFMQGKSLSPCVISPSPASSLKNPVWFSTIRGKLFFSQSILEIFACLIDLWNHAEC